METKPLLFGIAGLLLGGLIVSLAASTLNKPADTTTQSDIKSSFENKTGEDFDRLFLDHMILHHEDAVDIAKLAEKQAEHEEVKTMAKNIMNSQQKEIEQMKVWQTEWSLGGGTHRHTH